MAEQHKDSKTSKNHADSKSNLETNKPETGRSKTKDDILPEIPSTIDTLCLFTLSIFLGKIGQGGLDTLNQTNAGHQQNPYIINLWKLLPISYILLSTFGVFKAANNLKIISTNLFALNKKQIQSDKDQTQTTKQASSPHIG